VNRRIVKLGLVVVLPLLALPMLLGLECYTSDVFKTGGGSDTIPDGGYSADSYFFSVTSQGDTNW